MHGEPSRGIDGIEWEGIAERAAMHPPYFLLFDSRFIEVRHMVTGRLHQIIPGSDIHCIWNDRRCITDMDINDPDNVSRDGRVHAVMMSTDPPTAPRTVAQQNSSKQIVFELVLTETWFRFCGISAGFIYFAIFAYLLQLRYTYIRYP